MSEDQTKTKQRVTLFLKNLRDNRQDVEKCVDFLRDLQRSQSQTPPPMAETITMIKHEKPALFSMLKQRLQPNRGLNMLFQLDLNYNDAKKYFNLMIDESDLP